MRLLSKRLPDSHIFLATLMAFSLVPLSSLATDIYLPSLPIMVGDLHTSISLVRMSIGIFLITYGLAQFMGGVLADAWGRYRLTVICLAIFALANLGIVITHNIWVILFLRAIQGICGGNIASAQRAILVDLHSGEKLKHYLSSIGIVWSVSPIIAPFIGGILQKYLGWQASFWFMGLYCTVVLIFELIYGGETIKHYNELKIHILIKNFKEMLSIADFRYGLMILGLTNSMVFFFNLSAPFVIEEQLGFSAVQMGTVALIMGGAILIGNILGKIYLHYDFHKKLLIANSLQFLFCIFMLATGQYYNIYTLVSFAFIINLFSGFIFNTYFVFCLGRFPKMAGLVGGLTGGLTYIMTTVFSTSVVHLLMPNNQTMIAMGYLSLCIFVVLFLFFNRRC